MATVASAMPAGDAEDVAVVDAGQLGRLAIVRHRPDHAGRDVAAQVQAER